MPAALLGMLAVSLTSAFAQAPTAASILTNAQREAAHSKKKVMVMFHASWCGWCHKLDGFLDDPKMGAVMKANYVIVHLDVQEGDDKKSLENVGGMDYLTKFGGNGFGIPFTVILDSKGKMLANSLMPGKGGKPTNIGYPATPEEISAFIGILQKTAPRMKAADRQGIADWFKAKAPAR